MRPILSISLLAIVALVVGDPAAKRQAEQAALKPYGGLVGEWKGTGMVQPRSTRGSWVEKGAWAWKLSPDSAALELTVEKGKYLKTATIRPGDKAGTFLMDAVLHDGGKRTFQGRRAPATCSRSRPKGRPTKGRRGSR